jgi:hypothetical protein
MREIKFRAWDGEAGVMVYDIQNTYDMFRLNDDEENNNRHEKSALYTAPSFFAVLKSGLPIMQYTGLKDKSEKETYSDDIVSDGVNPPFVVDLWNWSLMIRLSEIEFEVIGNIYENPELIK